MACLNSNLYLTHVYLGFRAKKPKIPVNLLALENQIISFQKKLSTLNLRKLSISKVQKINRHVNYLYRTVLDLEKNAPEHLTTFFERLIIRVIGLKLGGRIPFETLFSQKINDFMCFIQKNRLHHCFQALRMQLEVDEDQEPLLPVYLNSRTYLIPWSELVKKPLYGKNKKQTGVEFFYFGKKCFETNQKLKLTQDYIPTYKGITNHNPYDSKRLIPYDHMDPKEWNHGYIVEVRTALKDTEGNLPTIGVGDHCHLVLKSSNGDIYSFGKFAESNELSFKEYFTLFGKKLGRFASPDIFVYLPDDVRHFDKTEIRVTEKQFNEIFKILNDHKKNIQPIFSILKNNCTSFIQEILRRVLDIRVDSGIFLPKYLLRAAVTSNLQKKIFLYCDKKISKMPRWLQYLFYFLPPVYIPTCIIGFYVKLFALKNKKGLSGTDFRWRDVFFFPWNVFIHAPLTMREELKKQKNCFK